MSDFRTIIGFGALVKKEQSYAAGATLSPTLDGVQGVEPPVMDIMYSYEGERPTPPGTAGRQAFASPTGETAEGAITTELRGVGAAYTTASVPPNVDSLLQAAGFTASFDSGEWTYTPEPIGQAPTSVAMKIFTRQQSFSVSGSFTDLELTTNDGAPMTAQFSFMGLPSIPTDETLPAITYNDTLPPKTTDIDFVWGSVSGSNALKIRSLSIALNREIVNRQDLNAVSGSAGFAVGRREPSMALTIEAPASTVFNPHQEMKTKVVRDFSFEVGEVAGNKYEIGGKGQIIGVSRTEDGPVATFDLEIALVTTTGTGNDDLFIKFS